MFQYRGQNWPDMSDYVVHLTKGAQARDDFYEILATGYIRATSRAGIARDVPDKQQVAACFSEIPVYEVDRLANRYSPYGVGFHHDVLVRQAGARVWYVELDKVVAAHLGLLFDHHLQVNDPSDPFWAVAPFIERSGVYANGVRYQFEWEREWRVPRQDMWFGAREVQFLFAPTEEHATLKAWLQGTLVGAMPGPLTAPLVLDPRWSDEQLYSAFLRHNLGTTA